MNPYATDGTSNFNQILIDQIDELHFVVGKSYIFYLLKHCSQSPTGSNNKAYFVLLLYEIEIFELLTLAMN